ncbi:hypothetical protein [Sphingomonas sp.]|uniref:hypothetical protein n=1 Tax=Sphingomonas sp. TaxID=28214 RepID=UPI003AFFBF26
MTGHARFLPGAAAIGMALFLAATPGVITYDGMVQYRQALAGRYDDWHPPIMAVLWSLLGRARLSGSAPMLAVQLGLYWAGLGLLAGALARRGAMRSAAAVLAGGLFPIVTDWMGCVLKDCQLIGALVAATGIVGWYRLGGRRMPLWATGLAGGLVAYAWLLRANAVFAVAPLALGLCGWGARRPAARVALLGLAVMAGIGVSGPINHRLLGAERSHVERTLPLFDMAGIAHRAGLATLPGLTSTLWARAEAVRCYTPFYWDPLGDTSKCGAIATTLAFDRDEDAPPIERQWLEMIAAHPAAWAAHRLAHLNDNLRVAVPYSERLATAPPVSLSNPHQIGEPARAFTAWLARLAAGVAATPAGVPAVWWLLAGGLWWTLAATPRQPPRDVGLALAASATLMTASFAIVSIASDLRYHLWLMAATMLAAAMLGACEDVDRRRLRATIAATTGACLLSVLLRSGLLPVAAIPA